METTAVQTSAVIPLSGITESVTVKDMNYEFAYRRIIKPTGNVSNLFNLFFKEDAMEDWMVCNGCLSDDFTVVRTEEAIRQIKEGLQAEVVGEKHYRWETSVKSTFLLSNYELDIPTDSEADKLIFKLITNTTADIQTMTKTGLSFNIINGFSGNHALQLNYGFMKNIYGPETTDGSPRSCLTSNNPFVLDEYTHRLIHDGSMSVSYAEVSNIRNNVAAKIELFKSVPMTDTFIKSFEENFPKKFVKKFMAIYENMTTDFRNMYWVSFIFGILIDSEKKIATEIKLRSFVKQYIEAIVRTRLVASTSAPSV